MRNARVSRFRDDFGDPGVEPPPSTKPFAIAYDTRKRRRKPPVSSSRFSSDDPARDESPVTGPSSSSDSPTGDAYLDDSAVSRLEADPSDSNLLDDALSELGGAVSGGVEPVEGGAPRPGDPLTGSADPDGPARSDQNVGKSAGRRARSGILEALALVCVAFALALTLKTYVAEAYEIKGRSMEPSFHNGERVVVLKAFYDVDRTDVIVFSSTRDPSKDLIKRVIGLPGETVEIREGAVFVNGKPLQEEYVESSLFDNDRQTVPEDCYYVLGDNRPDSHDSRVFKSIPKENVKGKVVVRWWPVADFRLFAD